MNCNEFNHIIDKILDGEITAEEESLYKKHIENCPNCKTELEELFQINEHLNKMGQKEVPESFTCKVVTKAKEEGLITSRPKNISILSKISMTAASFLFLFLLLDYTGLYFAQDNSRIEDQPEVQIQMQIQIEDRTQQETEGGPQKTNRSLRNTMVFIGALVLSTPLIVEVYKRKSTY